MKRKILTVLISAVFCMALVACNQPTSANAKQAQTKLSAKYEQKPLIGKKKNGLSEKINNAYKGFYEGVQNLKSLIAANNPLAETEEESKDTFEFKTITLDNKEIDSSIFKDNKLTMINIWATYCGPCISEMPDLQKLYEEVKSQNVNVVGVVLDTPDKDNEALAKKILAKQGVKYTNIIPDETLINNLFNDISAVPTTLFVDGKGNIIGEFVIGSRSKEEYKAEIKDRLKMIKK